MDPDNHPDEPDLDSVPEPDPDEHHEPEDYVDPDEFPAGDDLDSVAEQRKLEETA